MMTMLKSETASESLPDNHSEIPEIVKQEICDYCGVDCVLRKIPGDGGCIYSAVSQYLFSEESLRSYIESDIDLTNICNMFNQT